MPQCAQNGTSTALLDYVPCSVHYLVLIPFTEYNCITMPYENNNQKFNDLNLKKEM